MALTTRVTSPSGRSGASTRSRERRSERNHPRKGRRRAGSVTAPVHSTARRLAATTRVRDNGAASERAGHPDERAREGPGAWWTIDGSTSGSSSRSKPGSWAPGPGTWRPARTAWDERLEAMNGMAPGSFGGTFEDWQASIHPADRAECVARVERGARRSRSLRAAPPLGVARRLAPLARVSWARAHRRRRHAALGTIGVVLDVTEREEREAALVQRVAEDHRLIQSVQRALLPVRMPQVDGIEFAARYEARARVGDRRRLVRVRPVARRPPRHRHR